jgi:vitamin B12 transporter
MYSSTTTAQDLELNPVVVTSTRFEQTLHSVVGDLTLITREEVEKSGAINLPQLLATAPGVQISQTGGPGQSASVFLRGSNSDEVLILLDGMRINSATLGTASLENIPLAQVDHIEILRGPAANTYGSDAVGGVIQIFTKRGQGQPTVSVTAGFGSDNTQQGSASINGSTESVQYSASVSGSDTDGISAYEDPTNSFNADDDGYKNKSLTASVQVELIAGHSLGFAGFYSEGKSNYDTDSAYDNHQKSKQEVIQLISKNAFTDSWHSTLTLGQSKDKANDYSQPSPWTGNGKSEYETTQDQLNWMNTVKLPIGTALLGYERLEQKVSSTTDYDEDKRTNDAFVGSYSLDLGANSFLLSARNDDNSQYGSHATGAAGYAYNFTDAWKATASYGTAFKTPTFNQLYWPGFGNPDLKPEKSENCEASLRYETSKLDLAMVVFQNNVRNLVEFTGPPSGFDPVNTGKAKIEGVTLSGRYAVLENVSLRGNTTFQSAKNEETDQNLVRRSARYGTVGVDTTHDKLQFSVETQYASKRYNDGANDIPFDGYALVNTYLTYTINPSWKVQGRVNNILDKEYVLASTKGAWSPDGSDYGTEGTNAFVSATYTFK